MDKSTQRKIISERFAKPFDRAEASHAVFRFAVSEPEFSAARNIYIFLSNDREPDTDPIIEAAVRSGKKVFCPKVHGIEMDFHPYVTGKISVGAFGIREPDSTEVAPPPDLIFVPMVAFDENLNRLGHGKGYYDRFLKECNVPKIGLAFDFQKLDKVVSDIHDVRLDKIITETKIYRLREV